MKVIIQAAVCACLGFAMVFGEHHLGSDNISAFVANSGVVFIGALFAINIASTTFILSTLVSLEEKYQSDIFDSSYKKLKSGLIEQFALLCIMLASMLCPCPWTRAAGCACVLMSCYGTFCYSSFIFDVLYARRRIRNLLKDAQEKP